MKSRLYLVYTWIISRVCRNKRLRRRNDLRRYVHCLCFEICDLPDAYFFECLHISTHYRIPLKEVGYTGTFRSLALDTCRAFRRYRKLCRDLQEKNWKFETSPDELCLTVPIQIIDHDAISSHRFARANADVKKLDQRLCKFIFQARAIVARAFSLRTINTF